VTFGAQNERHLFFQLALPLPYGPLPSAADKGFQDGEPDIAEHAISAASGLGAPLLGFGKLKDAGALIPVTWHTVLARVRDEPGAAAKVVSHGDFSQVAAWAAVRILGKGLRFRRESAKEGVAEAFFSSPVPPARKPRLPSGVLLF